jgi:hypothetical protein
MDELQGLAPGENATMIPERWCPECATPRPKGKCSLCGMRTVEPTAEQIQKAGMGQRRDAPAPRRVAVVEDADPAGAPTHREANQALIASLTAEAAELTDAANAARSEVAALEDGNAAKRAELANLRLEQVEAAAELEEVERELEEDAAGAELEPTALATSGNGWDTPAPWSSRPHADERAATNPPRREGTDTMNNGQQDQTDDMGRRVVVMGGRNNGQAESSTAGEVLRRMWKNDQIDRALWCSMAGHAIVGTQGDAQKAAQAADALYFEMWERIHQDTRS